MSQGLPGAARRGRGAAARPLPPWPALARCSSPPPRSSPWLPTGLPPAHLLPTRPPCLPRYETEFLEDLAALGCRLPTVLTRVRWGAGQGAVAAGGLSVGRQQQRLWPVAGVGLQPWPGSSRSSQGGGWRCPGVPARPLGSRDAACCPARPVPHRLPASPCTALCAALCAAASTSPRLCSTCSRLWATAWATRPAAPSTLTHRPSGGPSWGRCLRAGGACACGGEGWDEVRWWWLGECGTALGWHLLSSPARALTPSPILLAHLCPACPPAGPRATRTAS